MRESLRLEGCAGVCFLWFTAVSNRLGWRLKRSENAQPIEGCTVDLYRVEMARLYLVEIWGWTSLEVERLRFVWRGFPLVRGGRVEIVLNFPQKTVAQIAGKIWR